MQTLNWIDATIILLLVGASIWGVWLGFLRLLSVVAGMLAGLIVGGLAIPRLLWFVDDPTLFSIINGNLVLSAAIGTAFIGLVLGRRFHTTMGKGAKLRFVEAILGCVLSVVTVLGIVWLSAASIVRLPFEGFSNSVNHSLIVQILNRNLPPTPPIFAGLGKLLHDPNSPPEVFLDTTNLPSANLPVMAEVNAAAAKASDATVRITSFGCGGIIAGSGFVVGQELVITNAHVIAGVDRPIIKFEGHSYEGVPVYFNPRLDIAILRVDGLQAEPLTMASGEISTNTTVAVLGYPSGDFEVLPSVIAGHVWLPGRNIYDTGTITRDVYQVYSTISQGVSGGPVVLADGRVAGMVFATVESDKFIGLALTAASLSDAIEHSQSSYRRAGAGACTAD